MRTAQPQDFMEPHVKRFFLLAIERTLAALAAAAILLYIGDYVYARIRLAKATATDPLETITINPYYEVPQKSGKFELYSLDPQQVTCVHAIFAHFGDNACWYVKRQANKPIPIP